MSVQLLFLRFFERAFRVLICKEQVLFALNALSGDLQGMHSLMELMEMMDFMDCMIELTEFMDCSDWSRGLDP